jgi:hypothetical protein
VSTEGGSNSPAGCTTQFEKAGFNVWIWVGRTRKGLQRNCSENPALLLAKVEGHPLKSWKLTDAVEFALIAPPMKEVKSP